MAAALTPSVPDELAPVPDEDLPSAETASAYADWREQIAVCYRLVKAERAGEIRGRRPRLLDERGIHPLSYEWGKAQRIWAGVLFALDRSAKPGGATEVAVLADSLYIDLARIRAVGRRAAEREFAEALRSTDETGEVDPWG